MQDSGVQIFNNPTMRIILFLTFITVVCFVFLIFSYSVVFLILSEFSLQSL